MLPRAYMLSILLAGTAANSFGQDSPVDSSAGGNPVVQESRSHQSKNASLSAQDLAPVYLTANNMSLATGNPSLVLMSNGGTSIPVWSLSGGTVGQSVAGLINGFPESVAAVKVEIIVTSTAESTSADFEDVYRVHLSQMVGNASFATRNSVGDSVRTRLPSGPFQTRTIVLDSYYAVEPNAPVSVRIQREPEDPADTFTHPTGLAMVKVTPLTGPAPAHLVNEGHGYNSWPMIQAMGEKLVCVYSRGSGHTIGESSRGVYARTSSDSGQTWTPETLIANTPGFGDVTVGKGLDSTGAMLVWVRRVGSGWHHDLYRTTDGVTFELLATPQLEVPPIQITDVFHVPDVGLVSLWFAGNYGDNGPNHSWGMVTSTDDGKTWKQDVIESNLIKSEWPTEPSAVSLGDGKILAVGRTEMGDNSTVRSQFQMVSTDSGKTWTRTKANIGDVLISTPSLILDSKSGLLSLYYYHRGPKRGILRRRVVKPGNVFHDSLNWPAAETVATGSQITVDAGNANGTVIGDRHFIAFYSGAAPETAVWMSSLPAPQAEE